MSTSAPARAAPGDFVNGATLDNAQTPPLPAGVAPADIRGIRVTFSARPVVTPNDPADVYRITPGTNFPTGGACTLASVCVDVKPRADLHSAPGTPTPEVLSDTATGGFESRQQVPGALAPIPASTATHQLTTGTAVVQFSKAPNTTAAPGVPFPFNLRLRNAGTGAVPDPVIVEPLPPGIDFSPTDPSTPYRIELALASGTPSPPTVVFTPTTDPTTGRVTSLRWEFPGWDLTPGSVVSVGFDAVLAPGVTAGQVIENRAGASGDRPDLTCNATGVPNPGQVVDDPAYGAGRFCTSGADVRVTAGNAFRADKWVAGDVSLGFLNSLTGEVQPVGATTCPVLAVAGRTFTRYPCVARVLPGGTFDFFLRLTNTGTNPATELRLVDVFPRAGDTGVILTGSARGTEWDTAPTLQSGVTITGLGNLDVGYSGAASAVCTTDLGRPPVACPAGAWSGAAGPGATAFRAIITFPGQLAPGGSTGLLFSMSAPVDPAADASDDIAWNSFAYTPFFRQGTATVQLPPTEPIKTGVAVVFGSLEVVKEIGENPAGLAVDDLEYTFSYACSVGGTPVRSGTVVATPGAPGVATGIPAGATCSVVETDTQGGVSSAPAPSPATAVIAVDGTAPPVGSVTVTNAFPLGTFTIDKAVAGTAAADFTAGPYAVDVDCTFQGTEVDGFPQTVSVDGGGSAAVDAPVGATCTAVETDDGGASAVSYDPASASAVIDAEDQAAEVTVLNTFESASLVVVKDVIGAGVPQFSAGPFVFDVTCGFGGIDDVFSTTVTIAGSADGSTVESDPIDGLPVGATCTVTETDSAELTSPPSPRR